MPGHDIVVIGASAGGVEALAQVVGRLPPDLPVAIFVVLHMPAQSPSVLPSILSRRGPLPAAHGRDWEPIEPGRIYVAPPDHHLLVERGHVRVTRGPRENRHRPAADPLFRTAAQAYGGRVVGVVLSGSLDDGTAGLVAVRQRGGVAVVQAPDDALFDGMPRSAIEHVEVDHCLTASEIGTLLARLAREPVAEEGAAAMSEEPVSNEMRVEADMAELAPGAMHRSARPGTPSGFSCPECHGVLWELRDGELTRYRCRVGHAYSPDSLLAEQSEALESALWAALRALEEQAAFAGRLVGHARERRQEAAAARFEEQAADARQRAELLRQVLLQVKPIAPSEPTAPSEVRAG